jgi:hypothetical protein
MALDPGARRAFLLCGGNRTFTVFDLDGHKSVTHVPLPAGADVVKFDPGLKRVYAASRHLPEASQGAGGIGSTG